MDDEKDTKKLELAILKVSRIFAQSLLTDKITVEWSEEEQEFLFTPTEEEHNEEFYDV
mgnify:CR=1 FL=1